MLDLAAFLASLAELAQAADIATPTPPLPPGRIAGAPCVPVWESPDALAYRREMGGRKT